jgi:hypothetical protein
LGLQYLRETYCLHPKHRNAYSINFQCVVSGSHASVVEDSGLPGYDSVSIDYELMTFSRSLLPPFSGSVNPITFLSLENVGIYQLTKHPIPKAMTLKIFGTLVGFVC